MSEQETISIPARLLEDLLGALASQKFISEEVPYQREEKQVAIDRVFNEAWQALAEARKPIPKEVLCRVEGVGYVVRLCFGTEEVVALGVRLGMVGKDRVTFWISPDFNMDERSVSFVIGKSTVQDVVDSFALCKVNTSTQKSTYRCIHCGNLKKEFCCEA